MSEINEREILRAFLKTISDIAPQDGTVSDLKIVKITQDKLKVALRDAEHRCTCAKITWGGICDTCQGSDRELVSLRNFYIQMRKAKRHNLTASEIKMLIQNTEHDVAAQG